VRVTVALPSTEKPRYRSGVPRPAASGSDPSCIQCRRAWCRARTTRCRAVSQNAVPSRKTLGDLAPTMSPDQSLSALWACNEIGGHAQDRQIRRYTMSALRSASQTLSRFYLSLVASFAPSEFDIGHIAAALIVAMGLAAFAGVGLWQTS